VKTMSETMVNISEENTRSIRVNMREYLDTIQKNSRNIKTKVPERILKFKDKYDLSQVEYELLIDKIMKNQFVVI